MSGELFLSPHNDDEALFGCAALIRHRPKLVVCLLGGRRRRLASPWTRALESADAASLLRCDFEQLAAYCDIDRGEIDRALELLATQEPVPTRVWAPMPEPNGHRQHNAVAAMPAILWPDTPVTWYSTYRVDAAGNPHRTTHGTRVELDDREAKLKRAALNCYTSQIERAGTAMHFEQPLNEFYADTIRLNLAGGINPIDGYVNLDKTTGWNFEDGLDCYPAGSVEAITISHALMYVDLEDWPAVFAELSRVLAPGGVVRITEDAIGAPGSNRPTIRPNAKVATTEDLVAAHLNAAGLAPFDVEPAETTFVDSTLIQRNYGEPPDVFHLEARKDHTT